MNRIERLSAILILLQSRSLITGPEIAKRFGISLRTVYRDMKVLEAGGVPLYGEGRLGYSLVDGYRLPPVQFSLQEATALLTASKLTARLTDAGMADAYERALDKIRVNLGRSDQHYLETIDEQIAVVPNPWIKEQETPHGTLQQIIDALSTNKQLQLTYTDMQQNKTQRSVEPVGVFFQTGRWQLIALCHLRSDYRHFRLDRIHQIELQGEIQKGKHPELNSFLTRVRREENLIPVVLEIENTAIPYLGDQKYYNGYVSEEKGRHKTKMKFLSSSLEGMARWYLMIGDVTRVLQPETLKHRVAELIESLKKNN